MFNQNILNLWEKNKPVINGWLAIPNGFTAEAMANMGWDALTIDMQHGANDYSSSLPMLQAITNKNINVFARVPWNEPSIIMKMLDARITGIICPMVNNKNDCENFVSSCYYPPLGKRSFGPIGAHLTYGNDYYKQANSQIITLAMIETQEAVENIDEILSVKDLTGIYIGPADMSISYGLPPKFDVKENPVSDKIIELSKTAKNHGKIAGIHTGSVIYAKEMINIGYQFITILSDLRFLSAYGEDIISKIKDIDSDIVNKTY